MFSSVVPLQLKKACIILLPKGAHPSQANEYRPLPITSILPRQVQKIVVRNYLYLMYELGSTSAALTLILECFTDMLINNNFVHVIALDVSKCFNTVRHSTMFDKIASLPLPNSINKWLIYFYQHRSHSTKFDGKITAYASLQAIVVPSSAVGAPAFTVAADASPVTNGNTMKK